MDELTFLEGVELWRSLRTAFRSRSALAQVVYDRLGEDLGLLSGDGDYGEVLVKLIVWAETTKRTVDLIRGARTGNPGADDLREFEVKYQQTRRRNAGGGFELPPRVLSTDLRRMLVEAILRLPLSATYEGRSAYLLGLPASPSRNTYDAQADLNTICDQLDGLGRLDSGQWPLLLVIDNILPYARGYAVHDVINGLRQTLEQAYDIR